MLTRTVTRPRRWSSGPGSEPWQLASIRHAPGYEEYLPAGDGNTAYHEAGYDAFMTGAIMAQVGPPDRAAQAAACLLALLACL